MPLFSGSNTTPPPPPPPLLPPYDFGTPCAHVPLTSYENKTLLCARPCELPLGVPVAWIAEPITPGKMTIWSSS